MTKNKPPISEKGNPSGIDPSLDRVLVYPESLEEVTPGGLVIPMTILEDHMQAQTAGNLVAVGPDSWTDYSGPAAKVGDRVMFAKYAGQIVLGEDGKEYRILNDRDITAKISKGVSFSLHARKALGKK